MGDVDGSQIARHRGLGGGSMPHMEVSAVRWWPGLLTFCVSQEMFYCCEPCLGKQKQRGGITTAPAKDVVALEHCTKDAQGGGQVPRPLGHKHRPGRWAAGRADPGCGLGPWPLVALAGVGQVQGRELSREGPRLDTGPLLPSTLCGL